MKIVFMGTPEFSVPGLRALVEAGHKVAAVVTQPDRQKGRGKAVQAPPVKEAAVEMGIPVLQPRRIRDEEWLPVLAAYHADLFVVIAFGQILPQTILDLPKYGCINVHASLLPKYRGAAPIQQCLIDGETKTGVTVMQMDAGLDTGDMLAKTEVAIDAGETGGSLHDKLSAVGARLLVDTLPRIKDGTVKREKQDDTKSCYAGMLKKELGAIDWRMDAAAIERLIRALNPWPSAYTGLGKKTLKLWEARVVENIEKAAAPGQILSVGRRSFTVAAGNGALEILSLQLEGKKRMDAESFLRGYPLEAGGRLGTEKDGDE